MRKMIYLNIHFKVELEIKYSIIFVILIIKNILTLPLYLTKSRTYWIEKISSGI